MNSNKNITLHILSTTITIIYGRFGLPEPVPSISPLLRYVFTNNKHCYLYIDSENLQKVLFLKGIKILPKNKTYIARAKFNKKDLPVVIDMIKLVYKDIVISKNILTYIKES